MLRVTGYHVDLAARHTMAELPALTLYRGPARSRRNGPALAWACMVVHDQYLLGPFLQTQCMSWPVLTRPRHFRVYNLA
jgi:hypothetical protein